MESDIVRLELVKALIDVAPRAEIQDPELIVKKAVILEKYILNNVIPRAKRGNQSNKS